MKKDEATFIYRLLHEKLSARLRAMFKTLIVLIGLVWASLMLFSWGGASEPQSLNEQIASTSTRS